MRFKTAFSYLLYRLFARHGRGHGIHSPFSYSFIRNVLVEDKDDKLKEIASWHSRIKGIAVPEGEIKFGAGSGYKSIRAGKIGISSKYGKLLYRVVRFFSPPLIIELGTGSGISAAYLASGNEKSRLISVEGDPVRTELAKSLTSELDLKNSDFITGDFNKFLENIKPVKPPFLAFIDGDHNYESTIRYFEYFKKFADKDSIIIFDDIRWSQEMEKAWKVIKDDPRVIVSIDLFFMGIVFFDTSITPQKLIVNF